MICASQICDLCLLYRVAKKKTTPFKNCNNFAAVGENLFFKICTLIEEAPLYLCIFLPNFMKKH